MSEVQGTITAVLVTSWSTKTVMASKAWDLGNCVMKSMEVVVKGSASGRGGIGWSGGRGRFGKFFVDWQVAQPSTDSNINLRIPGHPYFRFTKSKGLRRPGMSPRWEAAWELKIFFTTENDLGIHK